MDRLLAGVLRPGTRINETDLAEEFGVSRTPLREALFLLAAEGLIESRPRRGFYVSELDPDTARDLYMTLGGLEALALDESSPPDREHVAALRAIDQERARRPEDHDPAEAVDLDIEWHQTLVSGCSNMELLALIEQCRQRVYRYEYAYVADFGRMGSKGLEQHALMAGALERGDLSEAARLVRAHWEYGARSRVRWLSSEGIIDGDGGERPERRGEAG